MIDVGIIEKVVFDSSGQDEETTFDILNRFDDITGINKMGQITGSRMKRSYAYVSKHLKSIISMTNCVGVMLHIIEKFSSRVYDSIPSEVIGISGQINNYNRNARSNVTRYDIDWDKMGAVRALDEICNSVSNAYNSIARHNSAIENIEIKIEFDNEEKEKSNMNKIDNMFNGIIEKMVPKKVENGEVAMTINGMLAVKRKDGDYVSYDPATNRIVNSMQFVVQSDTINKFIYLMPMAQLQAGDIIKHNNTYYYVKELYNGGVKVVSLSSGAHSNIVDETNIMFGTTMYSKVVTLFNMNQNQNAQQTQANMQFNPMMLMMMDDGDHDIMEIMMISQMFGGQNPFSGMFGGFNQPTK